jgi:hypothetical protein
MLEFGKSNIFAADADRQLDSLRFLLRPAALDSIVRLGALWAMTVGLAASGQEIHPASAIADIRLDAPVTTENSCPITLRFAARLRVPKILLWLDGRPCPAQAIEVKETVFVFAFPAMTPAIWQSDLNRMIDRDQGAYKVNPDRFSVRIASLFLWPEKQKPWNRITPFPKPDWMVRNQFCGLDNPNHLPCEQLMLRYSTRIPGLIGVRNKRYARAHPNIRNPEIDEPAVYTSPPQKHHTSCI